MSYRQPHWRIVEHEQFDDMLYTRDLYCFEWAPDWDTSYVMDDFGDAVEVGALYGLLDELRGGLH